MITPTEKQLQQLTADNKRLHQQVDRLTRIVNQLDKQIRSIKAKQTNTDSNLSVLSRIINRLRG
jgi:peptidoglycan hydrolase CwlO-like protein